MDKISLYVSLAVMIGYIIREAYLQRKLRKLANDLVDVQLENNRKALAGKRRKVRSAKEKLERINALRAKRKSSDS